MSRRRKTLNIEILNAALLGYQHQLDQIDAKISEIRATIGAAGTRKLPGMPPTSVGALKRRLGAARPSKRRMSVAGRRRIAAAQKKRWAEYHRKKRAEEA